MSYPDLMDLMTIVCFDKPSRVHPKLCALAWVCLRMRSEDIIFLSVPILTVLIVVGNFVHRFFIRKIINPAHYFNGRSDFSVLYCMNVCIMWKFLCLNNTIYTFYARFILPWCFIYCFLELI